MTRDVLYIGFLRDIYKILCIADAAIAPVISGTDVHMKVIDYLSAGLPLNATPKAPEGLPPHALSEYPLLLIKSTAMNNIDLVKLINKFLLQYRHMMSLENFLNTYPI